MSLDEFDEVNQDAAVAPKKKMTVEKFFQQFNTLDPNNYGAWPLSVKITCWIFITFLILALGYFVVIKPKLDAIAAAHAQEQNLLNEFREKDSKLRNLQRTLINNLNNCLKKLKFQAWLKILTSLA